MGIESILGSVAGPLIGGILGGSADAPSQTTTNKTDPRMDRYLYGEDGKGGLLGSASALYAANPSGMNQQMVDGLNMQHGVYSNPANMQGYGNMANLGQSLMSTGMASNPFTNGQMQLRTGGMPAAAPGASPMQQVQALLGGTGGGQGGTAPQGQAGLGTGIGAFNPVMQAPGAQQQPAANPGPYSMAPQPQAPASPQQPATAAGPSPYEQQLMQQGYGQLPEMTGVNADLSRMYVLRDMLGFGNGG